MFPVFKSLGCLACLIPLAQLAYRAYTGDLGANPIETLTRHTGSWALIILLASLSVTPLRRLTGWNQLIKFRRMLGLFAFFYAALHFSIYMVLDHFFDWQAIVKDILKRPYVTVGFTALVIMIPLAVTSTAAMIRRMGKRWQQLHTLVYVAAILGVIHFYWLVKADIRRPLQYGAALAVLLGCRIAVKLTPAVKSWRSNRSTGLNRSKRPVRNTVLPERPAIQPCRLTRGNGSSTPAILSSAKRVSKD